MRACHDSLFALKDISTNRLHDCYFNDMKLAKIARDKENRRLGTDAVVVSYGPDHKKFKGFCAQISEAEQQKDSPCP